MLDLEIAQLLLNSGAPCQCFASEVLAADLERPLGLHRQLVGLGVELVGLELDPLTTGRHIGYAAADFLQQLELALV
jgi:hypothetical protein